jgi:hypothetical protein
VLLGVGGELRILVLGQARLVLLLPHVTEPLVEQQPEDVVLEVAGVDRAPQEVGGAPQVAFELGKGELAHSSVSLSVGSAASCSSLSVRPALSLHSTLPFALRPNRTAAAVEGDANR